MPSLSGALPAFPGGSRARAEEFARILDAPPTRRRATAAGSADVRAGTELARRLFCAGEEVGPTVVPRPEFRAALRTRLVAVAVVRPVAAVHPATAGAGRPAAAPPVLAGPVRSAGRASRALAVAAGVTASMVAVSGVAAASSQSLPGDPFYGVKRTTESIRLATADGELEQGRRHLDFATTRLRELRGLTLGRKAFQESPGSGAGAPTAAELTAAALTDPDVANRVRQVLADMDTETRKGTDLLTSAFLTSQTQAPLQALSRFATRQSTGLERLLPALPPASQDRAIASLALVVEVADETQDLMTGESCPAVCPTSPSEPETPVPTGEPDPAGVVEPTTSASPEPALPGAEVDPSPLDGAEPRSSPSGSPRPEPTPSATPSPSASPGASPGPVPSPTTSRTTRPLLPLPLGALGQVLPLPVTGLLLLLDALD